MGIGHAVYKNGDPRVKHLRKLSKALNEQTGSTHWVEISERIAELMLAEKKLHPNVDFYSASAYYALGIKPELFTPVFAASRTSGWTAHIPRTVPQQRADQAASGLRGPENRTVR